ALETARGLRDSGSRCAALVVVSDALSQEERGAVFAEAVARIAGLPSELQDCVVARLAVTDRAIELWETLPDEIRNRPPILAPFAPRLTERQIPSLVELSDLGQIRAVVGRMRVGQVRAQVPPLLTAIEEAHTDLLYRSLPVLKPLLMRLAELGDREGAVTAAA